MPKDLEFDKIEKVLGELNIGIEDETKTKEVRTQTIEEEEILYFTKEDFRKGIILSEILGTPKGIKR